MKKMRRTIHMVLALCFVVGLFFILTVPNVGLAAEPKEIVVGTPESITGAGAPFGIYQGWAYSTLVNDINKKGGMYMSKYKKKLPVRLVVYDEESVPDKAVQAVERLILKDKVHALFSTGNPSLVLPSARIAEREGIPMSAASCPIHLFLNAAPKGGWKWAWDIFFDEMDMTRQQYLTMDTVQSNKKVALLTDNSGSAVGLGDLWKKNAAEMGYTIVVDGTFPIGTSDFGDMIRRAKEAGADIVISDLLPPDSITLWKQMRTLGYKPKAAFFEKGGEPVEWWQANGQAAQGTMVVGYWSPRLPYPGAREIKERFEKDRGQTYSQHIIDYYTAGSVMLDAIERAGDVDPKAINAEMAKTNKSCEVGTVKYDANHVFALPSFMFQWQNGNTEIVYPPKLATAKMIYPLP